MKQLTIILPIYDRGGDDNFPQRWFNYSIKFLNNYKIFIADGSGKKKFYDFFNNKEFKNLIDFEYFQYPKDNNFTDYFKKLDNIFEKVKTEFSILADDDDFLSSEAIEASINFLKKNPDYSTSGGIIGSFSLSSKNFNINNFKIPNVSNSHTYENSLDRLIKPKMFSYPHTFYDVHRSHLHKKNFKFLNEYKFKEITMVEMLTEALDAIDGKINRHNELYAMRQTNLNFSAHKKFTEEYGDIFNRLIFGDMGDDCKKWLDILSRSISKQNNLDNDIITDLIKSEYIKSVKSSLNIKNKKFTLNFRQKIAKLMPSFYRRMKENFQKKLDHNMLNNMKNQYDFLKNIDDHIKKSII